METRKTHIAANVFKDPFLRNLFITTLIVCVVFPLYNYVSVTPSFNKQLSAITEDEAIRTTRHLSQFLIKNESELTRELITSEFINMMETMERDFRLEKLKIFSRQGEIIFSSDPSDIGETNKHPYFYNVVAKGKTFTKIVPQNTQSLEGRTITADVVESYVPIVSNGTFMGAFEIYYDITSRKEDLDNLLARMHGTVFALASIFLSAVAVILYKASKNILERKQAEEALFKSRDKLEQGVKERTNELMLKNKQLQREIKERRQVEETLREKTHDLGKRVKELDCLYAISRLVDKPYISLEKLLQGIIELISPSWEYPETICSRISLNGKEYQTENFQETALNQISDIFVYGESAGFLEICYLDEKPGGGESPFLSEERRLIKAVAEWIGHTIERVQNNDEKEKLKAQLQQSQKMESIGTLAGGIAHDFNNILFPIFGYAEIALDDAPAGSSLRRCLNEILHGAKRASDLVKQILTFSRQANKELKPLKIQHVIKEVLDLIRSSLPSTIAIEQHIDKTCGLVMADFTQIHQIAMNLITNAFHAMEGEVGKLDITLRQVELGVDDLKDHSMATGAYVCLTVADTGIGMDQSVIDRIFEPYFTTKGKEKGTGLGLAVVHGIVKSYGGDIRVCSTPGKGTAFHIYLPVIKALAETEKTLPAAPAQTGTERILLVDDEAPIVRMETQLLERLGYHITARTSSIEALETFRAAPGKFDLVLTDMTMPNLTGIQLSQKLMEIRPDIPIILCTGFSNIVDNEKARSAGIHGYIMKPMIKNEIAQKIRDALELKARSTDKEWSFCPDSSMDAGTCHIITC